MNRLPINSKLDIKRLKSLLGQYRKCALECDGLTRVIHTLLHHAEVDHQVYEGSISHPENGAVMRPHFWIELPTGHLVDYRASMWLYGNGIHDGVFLPTETKVTYEGHVIDMDVLPDVVVLALTAKRFPRVPRGRLKAIDRCKKQGCRTRQRTIPHGGRGAP